MLEPCPFCGTPPHFENNQAVPGGQIVVADCERGCPMSRAYVRVEHWNTRTPPTSQSDEWEGPLTEEQEAMIDAAWEKHKAAATSQSDEALVEELPAYFRKPEYTLPPYFENLLDRLTYPHIAAAREEGRREGIEEAAKVARDYASKARQRGWMTSPESAATAAKHIATTIRALGEKQP